MVVRRGAMAGTRHMLKRLHKLCVQRILTPRYIGSLNVHVWGNFDFCLTVFGGDNNDTYVLSCTHITGFKMKLN